MFKIRVISVNARIKLSARAALTGSQSRVVPFAAALTAVFIAFSVCNAVVNGFSVFHGKYMPAVFAALSLAVFTLAVSILEFFFQIRLILLARGIKSSDAAGADFFGVINACGLKLCLFFIKLIWLVFYEALPAAGAAALIIRIKKEPLSLRAACVAAAGLLVLACAGLLFYGVTVQRYSKSMFFLACYRDFSPLDALRESIKKTKGRLGEIFFFKAGFFPWFLLCVGVLPALYVIPYYKQSVTCLFLSR